MYLAGPEVFHPQAVALGQARKAVCARYSLDGVFPLDGAPPMADLDDSAGRRRLALALFDTCIDHLGSCAGVIANLTPFRGPSADVGTAVELGWAHARGLPVFAYTNHPDDYSARVVPDGLVVEDYGLADNLMCEGLVERSGGVVVRHAARPDRIWTDLTGFDLAAQLLARALGATPPP